MHVRPHHLAPNLRRGSSQGRRRLVRAAAGEEGPDGVGGGGRGQWTPAITEARRDLL
jgi:hypothetical protein